MFGSADCPQPRIKHGPKCRLIYLLFPPHSLLTKELYMAKDSLHCYFSMRDKGAISAHLQ